MKTFHLIISGKVQGVFFRASAKKVAESYGIKGWIRNTKEGNVEAIISGESSITDTFIAWCRLGPKGGNVDDVIVTKKDYLKFDKFEIIH
jgi:acylphosphatase